MLAFLCNVLAKQGLKGVIRPLKGFRDIITRIGKKLMKRICVIFLITLPILMVWFAPSTATVELNVANTLNLKETPRDTAMSLNGKYIYVLTVKGEILIYASNGKLKEAISVGEHVESIKVGPREDILLLTSAKEKTVQIIILDFIQEINIAGSPFKGNPDAPVVVATFNDFQ